MIANLIVAVVLQSGAASWQTAPSEKLEKAVLRAETGSREIHAGEWSIRSLGQGAFVATREIQRVAGRPEERLVNTVLLRAMQQARYAAAPLGHFGLATGCYTHFTSPIRRYPDLVVHRVLEVALRGSGRPPADLPAIADEASRRERVAMEAEREIVQLKKIQFMQDKVGATYDGWVSGVANFGFFVELWPRAVGRPWAHPRLLTAHYWLTFIGLTVMVIDLTAAGVVQGFSWAGLQHWGDSVVASMPFWWTRTVAGLTIVSGQGLFLYALWATARQPRAADEPALAAIAGANI